MLLTYAAQHGLVDLVRRSLIIYGDDVNQHEPNGLTALGYVVEALVDDSRKYVQLRPPYGRIFKLLLTFGADITDSVRCTCCSPLWLACHGPEISCERERPLEIHKERHIVDIVRALLAASSDNSYQMLNASTCNGRSILYAAASRGMPNVCRMLVERGARPNVGRPRYLPLIAACRNDDLETVVILLAAGADPNGEPLENDVDDNSTTNDVDLPDGQHAVLEESFCSLPLVAALEHNGQRVVTRCLTRLIEAGADVNRLDDVGWSPLHRAVECFRFDTDDYNDYQIRRDYGYDYDDDDSDDVVEEEREQGEEEKDRGVDEEGEEDNDEDESWDYVDEQLEDEYEWQLKRKWEWKGVIRYTECSEYGYDWQNILTILLRAGANPNILSRCGQQTPLRHLATNISRAWKIVRKYGGGVECPSIDSFLPKIETVFAALVERRDGLGAKQFEPEDFSVRLADFLMFDHRRTINLMLRMLVAGVGLGTLVEFVRGTSRFCLRSTVTVDEPSDELCKAVVVLNGYRVNELELKIFRRIARTDKYPRRRRMLRSLSSWLVSQRMNPTSLKRQCRTYIRKRLAAANGHVYMDLLIDRLVPHCPGINRYLKGADLLPK